MRERNERPGGGVQQPAETSAPDTSARVPVALALARTAPPGSLIGNIPPDMCLVTRAYLSHLTDTAADLSLPIHSN